MKMRQVVHWLVLFTFVASFLGSVAAAQAQAFAQSTSAEAILESMTPEERVGQLFLVTFRGTDTSAQSQIYDLIVNHHIGGVVLQAGNDNFVAEPDTLTSANQLINSLQSLEWDATAQNLSKQTPRSIYVPLFVGVSQDGDSQHDQILSGLTPVPDVMAIGATWRSDLAQQVGSVVGKELSAVGFNLLLGPSLDVVDTPNPAARSDLGTTAFGGDPFWVGVMGQAYITGLHEGSKNRMIVVAKHFPGGGSADRSLDEEVATVRKSLDQLKQVDLKPFFTAANTDEPLSTVDGFLVSHIRYQGFQGNIRATTRPISFDASALPAILTLPEFGSWRSKGGLVVSDALGSNAVRNFYSQGAENFAPRLVARDAFNAGNDLLYLGNITTGAKDGDTYSAAIEILQFFAQQYRNDQVFAQRVDIAVLRILSKKLATYGTFNISNVTTADINAANVGTSQQVIFNVARSAATLISPDAQELSTLLPAPPGPADRIVFLTDASTYQQCTTCPVEDALAFDALQKNVIRLYGQTGSAQIFANRLISYPFTEITAMLNGESKTDIEGTLGRASWVVISIADVSGDQLSILRRFFAERPNLIRNKNVILFSFTAPYYLDATDISKLTAYYALYSKQPAFIDVAARLLFQQVTLQGASPVSIPDVGYDLISETSPDPTQIIPLTLDGQNISTPVTGNPTAQATQIPSYRIGDTIALRAGPIMDRNGHIVPDGTVAQFTLTTRTDNGGILRQVNSTTVNGLARATFVIDKPGVVEVNVTSEPALNSQVLQFNASTEGSVVVAVATPAMTVTPTAILPTPTATVVVSSWVTPEGYPRLGGWLLVLVAIFGSVGLVYWAMSRLVSAHWGIRWALCILVGGLLGYNYLAFGLPGATDLVASGSGASGMLLLTFVGETLGGIAALIWMQWLASESRKKAEEK
jgi:beta-N-acetylhexosaminidase